MQVRELSQEQLDELKWKVFYDMTYEWLDTQYNGCFSIEEWEEMYNEVSNAIIADEISNETIYKLYEHICFVDDDFSCSCGKETTKTRDEIIEYLGLEEDFEQLEEIINIATIIEHKYYSQLKIGWYGYGLSGDLDIIGRLEDSIYKLEQVEKIDDIVVYRKTLDYITISETASNYHNNDLLEELDYYKKLAKEDKRIKLLFDEATKETCKGFDINYDDYINNNVDWVMENCSDEFLLELVNNIAEWLGIDNHLYL